MKKFLANKIAVNICSMIFSALIVTLVFLILAHSVNFVGLLVFFLLVVIAECLNYGFLKFLAHLKNM